MRRAERLFRIIQLLRRDSRPVTAAKLAEALEVSTRTVYRDIAHLIGSGVAIDGEAGVGYLLRERHALPPLTFTTEQIEALALGARLVEAAADPALAVAARDALTKLADAAPEGTEARLLHPPLFAHFRKDQPPPALGPLREALRRGRKTRLDYVSLADESTTRVVRPLALSCFGAVWLLSAWCELRADFRDFRVDRIAKLTVLAAAVPDEPGRDLVAYLARYAAA